MDKTKIAQTRGKEPTTKPLTEDQRKEVEEAKKQREKAVKAGKIVTK